MPLITVSGLLGSGVQEIAHRVSKELELEIYDDRKLLDMAPQVGIPAEDLEAMREPGFFDRLLRNKPQAYMDYMDAIIYEVSRKGEGVIIGHGNQMLLLDFGCALHVCVYAPQEERLKRITDQQGLSMDAAWKLIHKTDGKQRGFFRMAFDKGFDNPGQTRGQRPLVIQ